MFVDSSVIIKEVDNENSNSIVTYDRRAENLKSSVYSTSTIVSSIRQLQAEFEAQYQHDKKALTELNQRFRLLIDRVQLLESEKSKYIAQIANLRQLSNFSDLHEKWNEDYLHLQSDLTMISGAHVDYEFDFELFQLQIGIYQQLIDIERQWKSEPQSKLEEELKQSTNALITLRTSYADMDREIAGLHATREDVFKQYLKMIRDWCFMKKQQKKWELNIQTLKSQISCYKNLRLYSSQNFESLSIGSIDLNQYWSSELDKYVKKIRHDFEQLYATIYHEMDANYKTKMLEIQKDVEQAFHYQQIKIEELEMRQKMLQVEYEEVQANFSYEQKILLEFEATYAKLESELKSIEYQYDEQFEIQSKEIYNAQESLMTMAYGIDEMRRRVKNLEAEIIIYRHLLDSCGIRVQEQVMITDRSQVDTNVTTEKFVVESESTRKGSIGIKECDTGGRYIILMNYSTIKNIDLSKWVLERRIDSAIVIRYTIPAGIGLQPDKELIIYSKFGVNELASGYRVASSLRQQELVYEDLASWGMGNKAETTLFNQNGDERASLTQTIVFERNKRL